MSRCRPVAAALATVVGVGLVSAPPAAAGCPDVFPASFVAALADTHPDQRVTAAVVDTRTGCSYHLHRGMRITTASVVKAAVLGAVLLRAQAEARGLTAWERQRTAPMIELSFNNPWTSDLYAHVGGVAGMARADRRVGATATSNASAYGATVTTAEDRTRLALRMLHGGGPYRPPAVAEARRQMSRVHVTQQWGITAGVPAGWSTALKGGFYPMRGAGWRVGSTGFVRHDAAAPDRVGGYAITVLTDRGRDQVQGIRLVETVSRRVAAALTGGPARSRPVDRAVCTLTRAGESWATVATRVGLPPSRGAQVRHVSGGNERPLDGQRACAPTLR